MLWLDLNQYLIVFLQLLAQRKSSEMPLTLEKHQNPWGDSLVLQLLIHLKIQLKVLKFYVF